MIPKDEKALNNEYKRCVRKKAFVEIDKESYKEL